MPDLHAEAGAAIERALACLCPITAAIISLLLTKPHARRLPAALLGMLFAMPALLLLQRVNLHVAWWTFPQHDGIAILGMPVELWIGWTVLWGTLPTLVFASLPISVTACLLLVLDVTTMPLLRATLHLRTTWLIGEVVALTFILLPTLAQQRFTLHATHVNVRATLQVIAAAGVFLYLPAELVIRTNHAQGWHAYLQWTVAVRAALIQLGFVLALPGLSAVQEFATAGHGTPLPFDPPLRLVTTGVYRYVANPIQLSCMLTMLLWALLLRSPWLLIGPFLCVAYSAGIAGWDEAVDLRHRFGAPWISYRSSVHAWLPRWRPFATQSATLYVARDCDPCSAVRHLLEQRCPIALRFADAKALPAGSITRMRYVNAGETAEGVRAFARALEHLHLGWAFVGMLLRLPGIASLSQVLLDVSGFGPMVHSPSRCSVPPPPQ